MKKYIFSIKIQYFSRHDTWHYHLPLLIVQMGENWENECRLSNDRLLVLKVQKWKSTLEKSRRQNFVNCHKTYQKSH